MKRELSKELVLEILTKEFPKWTHILGKDGKVDYIEDEVYIDYRDDFRLDKEMLQSVVEAKSEDSARDIVYDYLQDSYTDVYDDMIDSCQGLVERVLKDEYEWKEEDVELECEYIRDYVCMFYCVKLPMDKVLDEEYNVNLVLENGGANSEYSCNDKDFIFEYDSELMLLCEKQGYAKEYIREIFSNEDIKIEDDKFLESLVEEIDNTTSSCNKVGLFVKMTLHEIIMYTHGHYNKVWFSNYLNCGLFNDWNGSGSTLEINLQQDFTLNCENVRMEIDGLYNYSVCDDIYGLCDDFYSNRGFALLEN